MKFSTREDINAPIEHVFQRVSDFQLYERAAMRRGAQVKRLDNLDAKAPGMTWQADFDFRGKKRSVEVQLEDLEAPTQMDFTATSGGMNGTCEVELIALSPTKTRLKLGVELKPQTLSARLLVQSLKLAKGNVEKRMQTRLAEFSDDISSSYKQTQTA
ncbi:SRPBCC family protein [Pseudooceanicola sp. MF1-13]|uniref:SRPBCC family protein n=1 Tax=Pseudooceanicola sp. MF1-13 TaxID=3379095 RepID=UPI00389204DA